MGFFQDLKMDLSQAVNELMPEEQKKNQQIDIEDDTSVDETLKDVEAALSADFGDLDDGIVEGSEQIELRDEEDVARAQDELKKDQKSILKQISAAQMASLSDVISDEPQAELDEELENIIEEAVSEEASEIASEELVEEVRKDVNQQEISEADGNASDENEELANEVEKTPVVRQSQWQDYMREKHRNEEMHASNAQTIVQMPATNFETNKVENKPEETMQPQMQRPAMEQNRMDESRVFEQKEAEPELHKPEVVMPKAVEPEVVKPKAVEPEVVEPEVVKPKVDEARTIESVDRQLVSPQDILGNAKENVTKTETPVMPRKQASVQVNLSDEAAVDETAVITKGMTIAGDVYSKGNLEVVGTINGNIEILGKLSVAGRIIGDSKAEEVIAESANITGMIHAQGTVKLGANSVVIGDIEASSAIISGAVKGNLDIMGPVILDTTAVVMGNIKSKSVQISSGAIVEGMCSQCYADVKAESFFD